MRLYKLRLLTGNRISNHHSRGLCFRQSVDHCHPSYSPGKLESAGCDREHSSTTRPSRRPLSAQHRRLQIASLDKLSYRDSNTPRPTLDIASYHSLADVKPSIWASSASYSLWHQTTRTSSKTVFGGYGQDNVRQCGLLSKLSSLSRRNSGNPQLQMHQPCLLCLCTCYCRWVCFCEPSEYLLKDAVSNFCRS